MSRPVHSEQTSGGDVETVFAILSSERWAQVRADALHDESRLESRTEKPDGGVTLTVSRALPDGIPGFLDRFLPASGRVVQTDDWGPPGGGTRSGTWHVDIPGAPVRLGGVMRLEPTGEGSRYVIDGEAQVKVPVIGGKAESFIASQVVRLMAKEGDVLRDAL